MDAVISVHGLRKNFGGMIALDGLSLTVRPGQIHGFLGPNGAGKSTTLRILLGLVRPDGGHVRVLGADPWRAGPAVHRRIGYVPGDVALWPTLTGGEVIDLLLRLRGVHEPRQRDELIERFSVNPRQRCRTYSRGNRQKIALIAAFAGDAELLLLDEPTSGLDPLADDVFRSLAAERRAAGATIVLSSHILSEVEVLADRVTIIRDGRTLETGTVDEIRRGSQTTVSAVLQSAPGPELSSRGPLSDLRVHGCSVELTAPTGDLVAVIDELAGYGITSLTCRPPTLEQIFLRDYRTSDNLGHPVGVWPGGR